MCYVEHREITKAAVYCWPTQKEHGALEVWKFFDCKMHRGADVKDCASVQRQAIIKS